LADAVRETYVPAGDTTFSVRTGDGPLSAKEESPK
jgi:hypothetical protein